MIWSLLEWVLGTTRNFLWWITGAQKEIDVWFNHSEDLFLRLKQTEQEIIDAIQPVADWYTHEDYPIAITDVVKEAIQDLVTDRRELLLLREGLRQRGVDPEEEIRRLTTEQLNRPRFEYVKICAEKGESADAKD